LISHTSTEASRLATPTAPATPPVPATPAPPGPNGGPQSVPTPGPTGVPAAPSAVSVIRAWADALRRGDVRTAARYFALPSVMVNGSDTSGAALVIAIDTRAQAEAANSTLPCGARLISADQRGRYVNALFRLTGRPGPGGSGCDGGVGSTARTNFVIAHGRIVEWLRAPSDPGDNGTPRTPTQPAPAPSAQPQPSV
jgi:hypothetical protein